MVATVSAVEFFRHGADSTSDFFGWVTYSCAAIDVVRHDADSVIDLYGCATYSSSIGITNWAIDLCSSSIYARPPGGLFLPGVRARWGDKGEDDGRVKRAIAFKTPVYLELLSAFEAERRGSFKGDNATRIQSPIAAKRKALNWRAVFSSCCVYLWTARLSPRRTLVRCPVELFPNSRMSGIVPVDAAAPRVFAGISRIPRPLHSGAAPHSPHFTLIGSQDLDFKRRPRVASLSSKQNLTFDENTKLLTCLGICSYWLRPPYCFVLSCKRFLKITKNANLESHLLASSQGEPGSIPGRVIPGFRMWGSCRTMPLYGGLSRGSPVSPRPFIPALLHAPYSPHFALSLRSL
ncbi:hypothetical protein PR048_033379 [Dryococelus australis]|uniref:Uncharacterized protein n=1 Tax=Dryococelus australis TaxID=614101 RepID=A0ABQ9G2Y6_9NEOP|nr:hypothetical protein PR048_033379 [Dryococelus australis]